MPAPEIVERPETAASVAPEKAEAKRAFTVRAILLGLFAAVLLDLYAYFNDYGIKQTYVIGNHLPIVVYTGLFAFVLVVNPLLRRFGGRLLRPFAAGEMAVMLGMVLVVCALPTSGLMRNLPQMLVMPQHYGKAIPDWTNADPLRYVENVNPNIFPARDAEGVVYDGFVQGIHKGRELPPLKDTTFVKWFSAGLSSIWEQACSVPFAAWIGPIKTWFPLLIVGFVFVLSLCRVCHKQWSENEQLAYPIADFAHALIRNDLGRVFNDIFYSRLFWTGFGCVLAIHVVNGWNTYDNRMIQIPLKFNLWSIWWQLPVVTKGIAGTWCLPAGQLFLTVIAFAYFVPEDVSLSFGLSLPLFAIVTGSSYSFGHPVTDPEHGYATTGAAFAFAAVILYTGRYYYLTVLKQALFIRARDAFDSESVWACRWFLLSSLVLTVMLTQFGLDWLLSLAMVGTMGVVFLILARVMAETGLPFMQAGIAADDFLMALLGPGAIGPTAMYSMKLVSSAFLQDHRECLSPYVMNTLRLAQRTGVNLARLNRVLLVTLILGLFAAGAAVLWTIYGQGATADGWMGSGMPNRFATNISRDIQKLKRTGKFEESQQVSGLARLAPSVRDTQPNFWTCLSIGAGLVFVVSFLRLRFTWWPLHPALFVFWGHYAVSTVAWSFFAGWLIKTLVVRFGGGRIYQNLKPLFIGVVVGDLCGGTLFIIIGTLRFFWTGRQGANYSIFPG